MSRVFSQQQDLLTSSQDAEAALRAAGVYDTENFSSVGPAGIFALYANPAAPLALVFLNEFVSVCTRVYTVDHNNQTPQTLGIGLLHRHCNCCVS